MQPNPVQPDDLRVDWRLCPYCGQYWPHISIRSEIVCWPCRLARAKADLRKIIASLQQQLASAKQALEAARHAKSMEDAP